jgi:hypothetical protein
MSLAFLLLKGLHQKPDNKSYFPRGKFWKCPYIWTCSVRGFTFSILFILLRTKGTMKLLTVSKDCINSNPHWIT